MTTIPEALAEHRTAKARWYAEHNCDHAHCQLGCEKPQPFFDRGEFICGRCWFVHGLRCAMVPCQPSVCD
jgi:hypothetical protein